MTSGEQSSGERGPEPRVGAQESWVLVEETFPGEGESWSQPEGRAGLYFPWEGSKKHLDSVVSG